MSTDLNKLVSTLEGMAHSVGMTDMAGQLKRTLRRYEVAKSNASAATTTAVAENSFALCPVACKVAGIKFIPDTAQAADATHFLTLTVYHRTSAGVQTAVGSFTTSTTALVQWVPATVTVTAANAAVAAGSSLTFAVTKSGASGATFHGTLVVTLEES